MGDSRRPRERENLEIETDGGWGDPNELFAADTVVGDVPGGATVVPADELGVSDLPLLEPPLREVKEPGAERSPRDEHDIAMVRARTKTECNETKELDPYQQSRVEGIIAPLTFVEREGLVLAVFLGEFSERRTATRPKSDRRGWGPRNDHRDR